MIVWVRELATRGTDLICIPLPPYNRKPLGREERETLRVFSGFAFETECAIPLEVFLIGGNAKRLAIHPARGGRILLDGLSREMSDGAGHELHVWRDPHCD